MKIEILEGNEILITCECGKQHKINLKFKDDDGDDISDLVGASMKIDGDAT